MQKSILTVSADKEFLEEIRSHLEEGGRFRICSVNSGAEALKIAAIDNFDVAILDAEISDIPFVPFTRDLIYSQPNLKLLIYPPNNNPHHPVIKGLVSHGFLNKPFFAPEVGSSLAAMFNPPPEPENEPELEQVNNPELENAAVDDLRGELLDAEIEILEVDTVNMDAVETPMDMDQEGFFPEDLLRNVNEEDTFDAESLDDTDLAELEINSYEDEFRELDAFLESMPPPDPGEIEHLIAESEFQPPDAASSIDFLQSEELTEQPTITEDHPIEEEALSADIPTMELEHPPALPELTEEPLLEPAIDADEAAVEDSGFSETFDSDVELPMENLLQDDSETFPVPPPLPPAPEPDLTPAEEAPVVEQTFEPEVFKSLSESPEESIPGTTPLGVKSIKFDYSCVIIPENEQQFIARDLSDRIGFILPQIHMTSGWRVTGISVRPLYLMWRISLPAATSPRDALCEIRNRTSEHLYSNFPELLMNNKEAGFWAADYLILSGPQSPSRSLIQDFINRVRKNQQESKL